MAVTSLPPYNTLSDGDNVQISGPNDIVTNFSYDDGTRSFYFQSATLLTTTQHGTTHITTDPIPEASCASKGLMSANDKCKVDAITQTRLGVLGFIGAGFPDDGGWLQGDIILASGTDFITLEKIGNVVKFTVDSPIPMSPDCESCRQLFWVRDETNVKAIRPPTCYGKFPDVNIYGELRVYAFPDSTLVDPANPAVTLNKRGEYPAVLLTRYANSITPNLGQFDVVLRRNANNKAQSEVGWSMTPGPTGIPECVWFMGLDSGGNLCKFALQQNSAPGLLGTLLYKGSLLTKQRAIITGHVGTVMATNQYRCRLWDVVNQAPGGDEFVATNLWRFNDPDDSSTMVLDSTIGLLRVGTLVDIWYFKISDTSTGPLNRYFFFEKPQTNLDNLWSTVGAIQFGDANVIRTEQQDSDYSSAGLYSTLNDFEPTIWGLTNFYMPLFMYDTVATSGTIGTMSNLEHRAESDTSLPGLKIVGGDGTGDVEPYNARPVMFWNRNSMRGDVLIKAEIGRITASTYPPYDFLLHANIDRYGTRYLKILEKGLVGGLNFVRVAGALWDDLPNTGAIRVLSPASRRNLLYKYYNKFAFPDADAHSVVLAGSTFENVGFTGEVGDVVELLPRDYTAPCVRLEFTISDTSEIQLQVKVGVLAMAKPYENDLPANAIDDFVRGLDDGYTVSAIYSQSLPWDGSGTAPATNADDFYVINGGYAADSNEYWNTVEIMRRGNQVWVWWNGLLIPPDPTQSAALPSPVSVATPYYPLSANAIGKVGVRMWPGSTLRRYEVRSKQRNFGEVTYGSVGYAQ